MLTGEDGELNVFHFPTIEKLFTIKMNTDTKSNRVYFLKYVLHKQYIVAVTMKEIKIFSWTIDDSFQMTLKYKITTQRSIIKFDLVLDRYLVFD